LQTYYAIGDFEYGTHLIFFASLMIIHKHRIAIFVSGNGSNAEAIITYFRKHAFIETALLLSNNPNAFALERAKRLNVPSRVFNKTQFRESDEVIQWLKEFQITHIVLAGFLWLIPHSLIKEFPGRIVNIHPSLLPKYGGKGMYGLKVHEAVKTNKEAETGITIHVVNEHYDEGKVLFQTSCEVQPADTAEQIAAKVNQLECANYPRVIEQWITAS
jgi:phosphoribosylglycinamide formyltransferase 1